MAWLAVAPNPPPHRLEVDVTGFHLPLGFALDGFAEGGEEPIVCAVTAHPGVDQVVLNFFPRAKVTPLLEGSSIGRPGRVITPSTSLQRKPCALPGFGGAVGP